MKLQSDDIKYSNYIIIPVDIINTEHIYVYKVAPRREILGRHYTE